MYVWRNCKMDIRNVFQVCFLMILILSVEQGLCDDEDYEDGPAFGRCPWIRNKLKNGRVRYRYKGRVAKFLCDSGYELAGKRSSTCVRGQWSNPLPACVARGCNKVPSIANGRVTEMYRGALLVYDCNPGYTLAGDSSIHCDGRRWNASSPFCAVSIPDPDTHCDFETYDLCGWTHDPTHDFDWKRNQFVTPSGHVGTGPSYDHTFGENKAGYYLYIEASSPRKINDAARIFSPVYPPEDSGGCFIFWYHMYGTNTGVIRVYLKPESHVFGELSANWQKDGDQGNQWHRGSISIPVLIENFQIVIEGIRGEGYMGDSAIDDVQLTKFDCESMKDATQIITENTNADSCRGRCRETNLNTSCGCNDYCHAANNCCNDYMTLCFEVNETVVPNDDEPLPGDYYGKTPSPSTETGMPLESTEGKMQTTLTLSLPPQLMNQSPTSTTPSTVVPATSSIASVSSNTTHSSLPTKIIANSTDASTSTSTTTVFSTKSSTAQNKTETVMTTPTSSTAKADTSKLDTTISITTPTTTVKVTTPITITIGTTDSLKSSSSTTSTIRTSVVMTTLEHTTSNTPKTTYLPVTSTTTEATILTATPLSSSTTTTSTTQRFTVSNRTSSYINTETNTVLRTISTNTTSMSPISEIPASSTPRYNLRPRKTTMSSLTTGSDSKFTTLNATILPSTTVTTLKTELSTVSPVLTSTPQRRRWFNFTVFPTSTSGTTTAKMKTSTIIRNVPETTKFRFPKPTIFTFPSTTSTTIDFHEMITPKAEPSKSGDSSAIAITVGVLIILCVIGGITYYFRKLRSKRQSKLDDNSEMRFLPENDYMEYSDASALDKILAK